MTKKNLKTVYPLSNADNHSVRDAQAVVAIKTVLKDLNGVKNIAKDAMSESKIYPKIEAILTQAIAITSQAEKGILNQNKIALMVKLITDLSQSFAKAKALNPLISQELIISIDNAVNDANKALRLTNLAEE